MFHFTKISAVGFLALNLMVLIGCGKRALTEEEKAQFQATLSGMSRIPAAGIQANKMAAGGTDLDDAASLLSVQQHPFMRLLSATGIPVNSSTTDNTSRDMAKELAKAKCTITVQEPKGIDLNFARSASTVPPSQTVKMEIAGESCPVSMALVVTVEANANLTSAKILFDWTYQVKDEAFKKYNDVDSINLKGEMSASSNMPSGQSASHSIPAEIKVKFDFNLDGKVHSQLHGDCTFYTKLGVDLAMNTQLGTGSGKVEVRLGVKYPKVDAEIAMIGEGDMTKKGSVKYLLNDKEMNEDEFNKFVAGVDTSLVPKGQSSGTAFPSPTPIHSPGLGA